MNGRNFALLLGGLAALRLVSLPILPVLDPTEARYAAVARDILTRDDWITPVVWRNGEQIPFLSKPPLLFWLQALCLRVLGPTDLAVRLPSFLAALGVLAATGLFVRRRFSSAEVRGALLILVSCPLFFIVAGLGLTDLLLSLAVTGAIFSHDAFTHSEEPRRARGFSLMTFAFLGFGMIAKGPIALVLFGLPVLCWSLWNRRMRDFRAQAWWPGLLLFFLPWLPWYVLAEQANPGFLNYFLLSENFQRFAASSFGERYGPGHKALPGTAFLFFLAAALPWFLLLAWRARNPAARQGMLARLRENDLQIFVFAIVIDVVFLSLSRHVLGTYVLPLLPVTALLLTIALARTGVELQRQARFAAALVVLYVVAIGIALPIVRGQRSTREIVAMANTFQQERGATGKLVFVDRRPFSALFYAHGEADFIDGEWKPDRYWWYIEPDAGHLLVLQPDHPRTLDSYLTDRLRPVGSSGDFSIWEPVAAPGGP